MNPSSTAPRFTPGDRVLVRDRAWRVGAQKEIAGGGRLLDLEALDREEPARLTVLSPPDEVVSLPSEAPRFDPAGIEAFGPWARSHAILGATLVHDSGLPFGALFGRVAPEAYQLVPTLRLLAKPRPRLLVADDVGLGKTIEAGLAMLELMARGRGTRVLIVAPPGLLFQWRDELIEKFGLEFTVLDNAAGLSRAQADLPAGVNPWDALPRVLTSIDFLKKETVSRRALRKRWDLVVVDEAHALAQSGSPQSPYDTQRSRLGRRLADGARGLLLLTATPHNGYGHSFRSLLELVEPSGASLEGSAETLARRVRHAMVRRMKSQIVRKRADGTEEPVFPPRTVREVPVRDLSPEERELLRKVGAYCSKTARQAEGTEDADLVSFAMQIVKKRALSSRRALAVTIDHRLEALRKTNQDPEPAPSSADVRDLWSDLPVGEAAAERTAARILRAAIPKAERLRKAEVTALNALKRLLRSLPERDPKTDALLGEIRAVLAQEPGEKFIVFTEYRDTLAALSEAFDAASDPRLRYTVLRGGMSPRKRLAAQEEFEHPDTAILLATDAASEGLNLQRHCRRVIHVELPWNPNRLEQRNGRVDRYLQTRPPEIRYLFYPDSPEDDVLHQLVRKLQTMRDDRVSTPDILGIIQGAGELERGLVDLDPEAEDVEPRKQALVRAVDERKDEFARNLGALISAGMKAETESVAGAQALVRAAPLLDGGEALERLVLDALGSDAASPAGGEGLWRISVPTRLRGPEVQGLYPCATFRRSIAVRRRVTEVEFITPLHPLLRALEAEVRRRLVHAYGGGNAVPRRLAARRVAKGEAASVVFTFLGEIAGPTFREERLIAIRIGPDRRVIGTPDAALAWLDPAAATGEVPLAHLDRSFRGTFDSLLDMAKETAGAHLAQRVLHLRGQRTAQADGLRSWVDQDLADRLRELDEEQKRASGRLGAKGETYMFPMADESTRSFDTRRAAARDRAEEARREAEEFARVEDAGPPRVLGALFLVPQGEN